MEKILFTPDGEEPIEFYVLETTRIAGKDYILVTEEQEGDGDAYILKDISDNASQEAIYEMVDDDDELKSVAQVFGNILDDVELV